VGNRRAARRKNDDSPRNLRYLNFPESFHWLIAKTQTQKPIRSLENLETRFFFQAILANQRHGKRANGYFGCTESATSKLQVPEGVCWGGPRPIRSLSCVEPVAGLAFPCTFTRSAHA
jgi:hypothetical protein